jgi:hypothetical protein
MANTGGTLPPFVFFNPTNLTLFGLPGSDNTTLKKFYRFDFIFSDDQGLQALANVKLTIIPRAHNKYRLPLLTYLSLACFLLLTFYLTYMLLLSKSLTPDSDPLTKHFLNSQKRFSSFLDVQVAFSNNNSNHHH